MAFRLNFNVTSFNDIGFSHLFPLIFYPPKTGWWDWNPFPFCVILASAEKCLLIEKDNSDIMSVFESYVKHVFTVFFNAIFFHDIYEWWTDEKIAMKKKNKIKNCYSYNCVFNYILSISDLRIDLSFQYI